MLRDFNNFIYALLIQHRSEHRHSASVSYLIIGVEHLVFGLDHVLFVIGLVLFIRTMDAAENHNRIYPRHSIT